MSDNIVDALGASPVTPVESTPAPAAVEAIVAKEESGEKLTKKEENAIKEYKLKVNGREKTVKVDHSNDEDMIRYLQKAEASDAKFAEAADLRKAAMNFIQELKTNPKKVLSDPNIGLDIKKLAEEWMQEQIQEMEKSPEQKEKEKLIRELEAMKKEREDEKKVSESKEMARLQDEYEKNIEADISTALDLGGLPKTARTVKNMAEYMMIALKGGIDLTAKDIAPIVKNSTLSEFKEVVNSLTDDQLEDFIGKEVLGRIRKRNVAKAKPVETSSSVKSVGEKKSDGKKVEIKKQTIRDWLKV